MNKLITHNQAVSTLVTQIQAVGTLITQNQARSTIITQNQGVSTLINSSVTHIKSYFPAEEDSVFKPYNFKMDEIDGFRYRAKVANFEIGRKVDFEVH